MNKDVFFILGSVRSGTTLLRDILKFHPNLVSPEETHIFRWAEPYNSTDYIYVSKENDTLKEHRKIDGVSENDYIKLFDQSKDRKEMMLNYFDLFKKAQDATEQRCFDKTPQNVYGLPLIKAYFPHAKIIHIVRNPLNVISSIIQGRGLTAQNLIGAINFWKESILILNTLKPLFGKKLFEFKYENLTKDPKLEISNLLDFLGESQIDMSNVLDKVNPAEDRYKQVLTIKQIKLVCRELAEYMNVYGYYS